MGLSSADNPVFSSTPVALQGLSAVTAVAAGTAFGCALVLSGSVECWGYGQLGELGDGTVDWPTPLTVVW